VKFQKKSAAVLTQKGINRRDFLKTGIGLGVALFLPDKVLAGVAEFFSPQRALSFYNTHTGEKLETVYWRDGSYVSGALAEINHILRDHRTGEIKNIDTGLLDLLFDLNQKLKSANPFHIISGFRSSETNSILKTESKGVVTNSLHLEGKAIDIRLPGCDLNKLHTVSVELRRGGVGLYQQPNFVHLDVGRVRYW
jgi:uncharacterized protein YcbK (DUF882 family)